MNLRQTRNWEKIGDWNEIIIYDDNVGGPPDLRQHIQYKSDDMTIGICGYLDSEDPENRAADTMKIYFSSKKFIKDFLETCKSKNLSVDSELLKPEIIVTESQLKELKFIGYDSWKSFIEDMLDASIYDKDLIVRFFNCIEESLGPFDIKTQQELAVVLNQINPAITHDALNHLTASEVINSTISTSH